MTQKEFINHVLINEIGDVVDHHKWLSFILICSGIEFLGGCIDHEINNLHASNRSRKRFESAIRKLFPSQYEPFLDKSFDLYSQLRCGMSHVTIPGIKIAISETSSGHKNLSEWGDRIIFIAEDLFIDFKRACLKVIDMIDQGQIKETFEIRF